MPFSVLRMLLVAINGGDEAKIERYETIISKNETVRKDFLSGLKQADPEVAVFVDEKTNINLV